MVIKDESKIVELLARELFVCDGISKEQFEKIIKRCSGNMLIDGSYDDVKSILENNEVDNG